MVEPLQVKVPVAAVELPKKSMVAFPKFEPLTTKVALPAVVLAKKLTELLRTPGMPPSTVILFELPALALPVKAMSPPGPPSVSPGPTKKFCITPELLITPGPSIVKASPGLVMVKTLALGLKMTLLTVVLAERLMAAVLETPKVAVSAAPFGTVAGVQWAAVFQSPDEGLRFQVALPATQSW